jgi:hypothetical protein
MNALLTSRSGTQIWFALHGALLYKREWGLEAFEERQRAWRRIARGGGKAERRFHRRRTGYLSKPSPTVVGVGSSELSQL